MQVIQVCGVLSAKTILSIIRITLLLSALLQLPRGATSHAKNVHYEQIFCQQ